MNEIVESVPNISEGKNKKIIDEITGVIDKVDGVVVLDIDSDPDHNRTVISMAGSPESVVEAVLSMTGKAIEQIDLNAHSGEHPRMGAVDVIPFIPIRNISMKSCVQLSKTIGEEIASRYNIPVYLYEKSATRPERENLAKIRSGEFEVFPEKIEKEDWEPDYGPRQVHPTAGVCAVGARMPLIAYNVNLGTDNLEVANKIAKAVRHSSGGLRYVKALGFDIEDRGIVQVSMNMTNYKSTPLFRVFELIKREAKRYGVSVVGSEIVGMVPQEALNRVSEFYLQLEEFQESMVLENRIRDKLGVE